MAGGVFASLDNLKSFGKFKCRIHSDLRLDQDVGRTLRLEDLALHDSYRTHEDADEVRRAPIAFDFIPFALSRQREELPIQGSNSSGAFNRLRIDLDGVYNHQRIREPR